MKRIEALIIGIIASLTAGLILAPHLIPVFWQAYKTELSIFVPLIIFLGLLHLIWERTIKVKKRLAEAFEVFKPVEKLTSEDFHITNYNPFYIERESDKEIEKLLSERKYVFITGIPMLGKTRMAYEAIKKLKGFYLLKPLPKEINIQTLKLPLFRKKSVLFLDDLDKFVDKFNLDWLIGKIKRKSKEFVVIATCRSGKEFDEVFAKKEMENLLTQCQKNKIEPRCLKVGEERNLAANVGKNLDEIASDGTPGSITIDLRYMKQRYDQLGDEKSVLKCLKLLREGNISFWNEDLVKEISKSIFGLNTKGIKWDNYIKSLIATDLIKDSNERIQISHDIYLDDRFLHDYMVGDHDLIMLRENLFELKDAENLCNLGNAFYFKKNQDEALECYQKSIQINPDYVAPHYNLGTLLYKSKRYEPAEKEYREALRIKPNFATTHYNLGILLYELKRYDEAEKEFRDALRINPGYTEARNNLGVLFDGLKRYEEAEKEYREALRINPEHADAHNNLGACLSALKRYEEAEKAHREALRINPDHAGAHNNLGGLLYELKRYEEAEKEYKEALRINPEIAEPHYNLGVLLDVLKKYEEAEREYRVSLRINWEDAKAHYNLGILLYKSKRYEEAEKEYREALRINPDYAEAHFNLGCLLDDLKRPEEAEKEYREALRINPDDADIHCSMGELLVNLDRKDEAKKEFEIARNLFLKQGREEDAKKVEGLLEDL